MATSLPYQNNTTACFQQCFFPGRDGGNSKPAVVFPLHQIQHQDQYDTSTRQEMKPSEDFLASELSKISVQERMKALDDLHCVGEDLTETPELIENSLAEMDRILRDKNDPIYNAAASQNKAYVEDSDFRLRFIRANNHDPEKAADQMIGLLTEKEIYFGRDKLGRDITFDDLNDDDLKILLGGRYHIQDALDRNGRIVVYFLNHHLHLGAESLIRANYFVYFNVLSPLASVQKKGIVVCYYDMSKPEAPMNFSHFGILRKFMTFMTKVPVRRTGMHFCLKTIPGSLLKNNFILEGVFKGLQQSVRVRARMHYGSDIELQYKLRSHGMPMENIPVDINGNIRSDILNVWFHRYLAKQRNQELVASSSTCHPPLLSGPEEKKEKEGNFDHAMKTWNPWDDDEIDCGSVTIVSDFPWENSICSESTRSVHSLLITEPTPKDVLLGRGRGYQLHPGNISFRKFLEQYQQDYNDTPRYKRVETPKELTRLLLDEGVRFLKMSESGDGWEESNYAEAEKKVKQFFRSRKKLSKTIS